MSDGQGNTAQPSEAKVVGKASAVASTGRTDAVSGGIAKTAQSVAREVDPATRHGDPDAPGTAEPDAGVKAKTTARRTMRGKAATAAQAASALAALTADLADDADDDDDAALPTGQGTNRVLDAARDPKGTADELSLIHI